MKMSDPMQPGDIVLALTPSETDIICRALAAKAVHYATTDPQYAQQIRMIRARILTVQDLNAIRHPRQGADLE